jgi:hypothetical protein
MAASQIRSGVGPDFWPPIVPGAVEQVNRGEIGYTAVERREPIMKQLNYSMQFRGKGAPTNDEGTVLSATTTGKSCTLSSSVGAHGLGTTYAPADGDEATFVSEVRMTGETTFVESGCITFGGNNRLHFSPVGEGYMGPSPDPKLSHGAVVWRVDRGEGQFEGASGLITSNFSISDTGM